MAKSAMAIRPSPRRALAAGAAHRARHLLAWRFQVLVAVLTVTFGILALLARTVLYFPVDLAITRAVQAAPAPWLGPLLGAVGWLGFPPQSIVIFGLPVVVLFLAGRRLEALMSAFAALGSAGLWFLIAPVVNRPRPSPDLVNVASHIPFGSFPSGHVLNLTAMLGFYVFLSYVLLRPSWRRTLFQAACVAVSVLVGAARIYSGQHWPSDVLGGYMLGGLWLAITIHLYRRARQHAAGRHAAVASRDGTSRV